MQKKKNYNNTDKQTNEQNNFLKRTTFLISVLDLGLVCPILKRQTDIPRLAYSPMHHPRSPKYQGGEGGGKLFRFHIVSLTLCRCIQNIVPEGAKTLLAGQGSDSTFAQGH